MQNDSERLHYAIALGLGVVGLLIILIFVSIRSQADTTTPVTTVSISASTPTVAITGFGSVSNSETGVMDLSAETNVIVKKVNSKLDLIEKSSKSQFLVSQKIINTIVVNKMPEIKITDISYDNDIEKGKKVNIEGIAPSREALLSFRLALEGDKNFKQVDLPISNFVKGSNIQFSLSLIPS